jgi:hypothetical protein
MALLPCALVLALASSPAHAQYAYPPGYAGWGGWGASTPAGSTAAGMGSFAAGAGSYNVQTAQARSINAQTAMEANEYMYQNQQRRNRTYQEKLAREKALVNETAETNYNRIHDNPNSHDIHSGDAANVILDELVNPKVFATALQAGGKMPVPSSLVKAVPMTYAPQAMTVCLEELHVGGAPDVLQTNPAFEKERKELRAIAAKVRKQSESEGGQIDPELLVQARTLLKSALKKVDTAIPAGQDQQDAENFLKAVYGLTKMLQKPNIKAYLKDLDKIETTDLGHLISFMHSFGLRFGAANTPEEEAAHDAIYPALVNLRDTVIPGGKGATPFDAPSSPPDPKKMTAFFSGMDRSAFEAQRDPHTGQVPPPPPARP